MVTMFRFVDHVQLLSGGYSVVWQAKAMVHVQVRLYTTFIMSLLVRYIDTTRRHNARVDLNVYRWSPVANYAAFKVTRILHLFHLVHRRALQILGLEMVVRLTKVTIFSSHGRQHLILANLMHRALVVQDALVLAERLLCD